MLLVFSSSYCGLLLTVKIHLVKLKPEGVIRYIVVYICKKNTHTHSHPPHTKTDENKTKTENKGKRLFSSKNMQSSEQV